MFEKFERKFAGKNYSLTNEELEKRRAEIYKLRQEGKTLQFIGDIYDLSRERIRQILNHK